MGQKASEYPVSVTNIIFKLWCGTVSALLISTPVQAPVLSLLIVLNLLSKKANEDSFRTGEVAVCINMFLVHTVVEIQLRGRP